MTIARFDDLVEDAYQPLLAPPRGMSDDETALLARLRGMLRRKQKVNRIKERYYEAKQFTRYMDISVPPMFQAVGVAVGWPGTVVDAYEERIDFRGWASSGDLLGLDEVYADNYLDVEASRNTLDTLLFGMGFMAISQGDPANDEPELLVTAESSLRSTMLWDYRKRRAEAAYTQTYDERNRIIMETFYTENATITLERDPNNVDMVVKDVDDHNLGHVPVVRFTSGDRASDPHGRSLVTRPLRYYTDAAVRTVLGMEINREFYTTPATFALNVRPEMFGIYNSDRLTPEQKARIGWSIMMGNINLVPPPDANSAGDPPPDIKQLSPAPPGPYLDQIEGYAKMVNSATGLPMNYLGFGTSSAADADAIRAEEYPMVRRAERRINNFAHSYKQLAWLCCLWRDGEAPDADKMRQIRCRFADPSAPTRGAQADEAQKLTAVGILTPDSTVTYERIGLDQADMDQLAIDKRKARMQALAAAISQPQQQPGVGDPNPGAVTRNGNQGTPAAPKNPANVQRGTTIAQQSGQA
jgi:hypothetical protein